jgi:hypothetical protein
LTPLEKKQLLINQMKNWKQAKEAYIKDHLSKALGQPERRLNALSAIEKVFSEEFPELLADKEVFINIKKVYLTKLYESLKGTSVSSAEKSVINGLYKFSI